MNEKDKTVWYAAVNEWMTSSAGQDLGKFMFEKALTHRDEQVRGLVEALEIISKNAEMHPQILSAYAEAALAAYKEQSK